MYKINNYNHSSHSTIAGEYRKIECPFPKGILFHRCHLWDKEKYMAPHLFGAKRNKKSSIDFWQW